MNKLFNFSSLEGKIKIKHGFAFKGEYFASSGDYILLTPGNIYPDGGFKLDEPKEKYYNGEFPKSFLFEKGDLVTVMTDLTQEAIILGGAFIVPLSNKFLHNQRLGKIEIIDIDELDKKFLYYCFNFEFFRGQVRGSASGTTVKHTAPERIYKCKIPLPPLPTQQRIASILSAYDDLIEVNNQRIKLLEQTARELYKEWFVRMRFPGYKQAKFKKGVPEGWEVKKIGDVCKVARGSSPRPIVDQRYFVNGNIPWVKIADATASGKFLFETKEYVNDYGASFSRKLKEGSLIIATSGTLGFCIFLAIEACIHDGWLYTTDYKLSVTPEFLFFIINDRTEYFNNLSYGAAIQNINTDILRNTPFLLPSKVLLEKFQEIIVPINEQQKNLQQQNTQLRQIRDRLLPRLISGKLEVSEL